MYVLNIKDDGANINAVVVRSLLALAGIASLLYRGHTYFFVNVVAAVLLFTAAIFVNRLLTKMKIPVFILMIVGAVLVLAATLFIPFAVLLIAYGALQKKLYTAPVVTINSQGIHVVKPFGNIGYSWAEFHNIILKDNLLTLDFRNNTLLQLLVAEPNGGLDEHGFNDFCKGLIKTD